MKPKPDAWSTVIVGYWNRMIFTPEWVGTNIFQAEELEKLIPLVPVAPVIYQDEDVSLTVEPIRLVFRARHSTPACVGKVERMAVSVLEILPQTPVSAVGVNFGFTDGAPDDRLLDIFNFKDNAEIGSQGWDVQTRTITRLMRRDGRILNLTLNHTAGSVEIDTNFHCDVASANEAADTLKGKSAGLMDECLQFIDQVYGLKFQAEVRT